MKPSASPADAKFATKWVTVILLLAAILLIFFFRSFVPGLTLFNNDGPLGRISAEYHNLPEAFTGVWNDLNSVGYREQGALTSITYGLRWALGNLMFSKFYVPIGLLISGLGAWYFFRESKLAWPACILGAVATVLNGDFFSTACWGIAALPITVGMTFFAMAALLKTSGWRGWVRVGLAGAAVGIGVADGADVGAIFSIFVGAFLLYEVCISEGTAASRVIMAAGRLPIVVLFAILLAAQPLSALISTQIKDVAGLDETIQTPEEHWNWATQWSLPKKEALSLVVPGLFGYRMDSVGGASYWGEIGRDAAWVKYFATGQQGEQPRGLKRYAGSGIYCGVTVVLLAVWAALQSFVRQNSVFSPVARRRIWFCVAVAIVSLLLGFGRHAPFYQFLYRLPFFRTIRNPIKFLEPVNFCLIILFAYGADGLWRRYMQRPVPGPAVAPAVAKFDRRWIWGCIIVFILGLAGWGAYAANSEKLQEYLLGQLFSSPLALSISDFTVAQPGWFVLFFGLMALLVVFILRGGLAGSRAVWGAALIGLLVFLDLGRTDRMWIIYWDYADKYTENPILQILKDKPYEHRVTLAAYRVPGSSETISDMFRLEWMQQEFPFLNIQALDIVQLSRTPRDLKEFLNAVKFDGTSNTYPHLVRRYELTNTRYIIGNASYGEMFNAHIDPERRSMRILTRFNLVTKTNSALLSRYEKLTAQIDPNGVYALFEFTNALPRAKLFTNWQIETNELTALSKIIDPAFDFAKSVFVSENIPAPPVAAPADSGASGVSFASYAPRKVVLNATNTTASVLLLNDRFDPNWHVTVDGKPAPILHCNFLMRGVYLEPGAHVVEYQFNPPTGALYVSLGGMAAGIVMLGVVMLAGSPRETSLPPSPEAPKPIPAADPPPALSKKAKRRMENARR